MYSIVPSDHSPKVPSKRMISKKPGEAALILVAPAKKISHVAPAAIEAAKGQVASSPPAAAASTSTASLPVNPFQSITSGHGMILNGKTEYTGEMKEMLPHGKGVFTAPRSSGALLLKYEGMWEQGQKCGQGVATYRDGTYTGLFFKDQMHGQGKLVQNDGVILEGLFEAGILKKGTQTIGSRVTSIVDGKEVEDSCCGSFKCL